MTTFLSTSRGTVAIHGHNGVVRVVAQGGANRAFVIDGTKYYYHQDCWWMVATDATGNHMAYGLFETCTRAIGTGVVVGMLFNSVLMARDDKLIEIDLHGVDAVQKPIAAGSNYVFSFTFRPVSVMTVDGGWICYERVSRQVAFVRNDTAVSLGVPRSCDLYQGSFLIGFNYNFQWGNKEYDGTIAAVEGCYVLLKDNRVFDLDTARFLPVGTDVLCARLDKGELIVQKEKRVKLSDSAVGDVA